MAIFPREFKAFNIQTQNVALEDPSLLQQIAYEQNWTSCLH
jgi:hypothetical protein